MQRLEVSGAVRPPQGSLGVKGLILKTHSTSFYLLPITGVKSSDWLQYSLACNAEEHMDNTGISHVHVYTAYGFPKWFCPPQACV